MKIDQFLDELSALNVDVEWHVTEEGTVRGINKHGGHSYFCPITAVCLKKKGLVFGVDKAYDASEEIGLAPWDAMCIIAAADNHLETGQNVALMRQLLEATIDIQEAE